MNSLPYIIRNLAWMAGIAVLPHALGCSSSDADGSPGGTTGSESGEGGSGGEGQGGAGGQGGQGGQQQKTVLRVPLYPYIPDAAGDQFTAMTLRIEAEFEKAHPEIDLQLNPSCFADDFYDPASLAQGLAGENTACPYDLVEVDMLLLGELVATGAIRPWEKLPAVNQHQAGVVGSTLNGELYGVPHWLCGEFVFSRDASVEAAGTATALASALDSLKTIQPNMAGNLLGSWNLPSLYLDAWADTKGPQGVATAISTTMYDATTLDALGAFSKTCESNGTNPCIDGTYDLEKNIDWPAQRFANGEVDAVFGFSEMLHVIRKNLPAGSDPASIRISSAPLGNGNHPLLYTDSFVVSVKCKDACAKAADAFVAYMSAASTYEWIMASDDAAEKERIPRYLMAASLDAYATPKISKDPFYKVINERTQTGVSFPNAGLLDVRKTMADHLLEVLKAGP